MNTTLRAALDYAALGWPTFPLIPRGKRPLTEHGCKDATTDTYQLAAWWRRWPDANLALATGPTSGVWVLDLDGQAGRDNLHRLIEQHGDWRRTVAAISGGGGWHLYFAWPADRSPRSTLVKGWSGVDVRGHGGSCTLAPSLHASGQRYRWCRAPGQHALAEAPGWLLDLVDPPRPIRQPMTRIVGPHDALHELGDTKLREACERAAFAAEGTRNPTLNTEAFWVGRLIGGGLLDDEGYAEGELMAAALQAGLPEREARGTVRSGLNSGRQHPWAPDPLRRAV